MGDLGRWRLFGRLVGEASEYNVIFSLPFLGLHRLLYSVVLFVTWGSL